MAGSLARVPPQVSAAGETTNSAAFAAGSAAATSTPSPPSRSSAAGTPPVGSLASTLPSRSRRERGDFAPILSRGVVTSGGQLGDRLLDVGRERRAVLIGHVASSQARDQAKSAASLGIDSDAQNVHGVDGYQRARTEAPPGESSRDRLPAMARVVSTGGLVTILDPDRGGESGGGASHVNLNLRLFALEDRGLLAIDPASQSFSSAIARERVPPAEGFSDFISSVLRLSETPSEHRQGYWGGVVSALRELGIETDPETLQALPFEAVPIGRAAELLGG